MTRFISLLFVLFAFTATAQEPERPLALAMDALRSGDWGAAKIAARGDGNVAVDVIEWHYLRAGRGDAAQVQSFLKRRPDWPGLPYLRKQSEAAMAEAPGSDLRAFYEGSHPQTGQGVLSLAQALWDAGEQGAAQAEVVLAWRTLALGAQEQAQFLEDWPKTLAAHHEARLDRMLWNGWEQNARRMLPLVSEDWQKLAEARIALRERRDGVDALIDAVPEALADHPGLAYERFNWRDRAGGLDASAIELMLERSADVMTLGEPDVWARQRRNLTRQELRAGRHQQAYDLAARHGLSEGSSFADLEWLAGYLSLRHLNEPARARDHFLRFLYAVETPISKGRGGYWLGRAYEALGDTDAMVEGYALGAAYQTSFYGLLAAERGGIPLDPNLAGNEVFPPWQAAAFTKSSVFEAAILLLAAGELNLAERFFTHLTETLDRTQVGQLGAMLAEMDQPHIQVMVGKRAASFGIEVPGPYYAMHPLADRDMQIPAEMALAIARRESEFDPSVVSGAGARGLMQVMPATAREVAGKLGVDYVQAKLTADPSYNATLGTAYLAELAERFGGNPVMVSAAYNAGPSRPERWMRDNGDPRAGDMDIVDWIELIPFTETRNYVMRVTESLPVYRARLGLEPLPVPFSQELLGSGLLPGAP